MTVLADLLTILSLSLTVPFLLYAIEILMLWGRAAFEGFRHTNRNDSGYALARGIFVGFGAAFLDNLYWGITWVLVLLDHEVGMILMLGGAAANVIFRQSGGLYSAFQHVKAAYIEHGGPVRPTYLDRLYLGLTVGAGLVLAALNWLP